MPENIIFIAKDFKEFDDQFKFVELSSVNKEQISSTFLVCLEEISASILTL